MDLKFTSIFTSKENAKDTFYIQTNLKSSFQISSQSITNALIDFSINKNKCFFDKVINSVRCDSGLKDSTSLLYFSEFWIQLDNSNRNNKEIKGLN